MRDQRWVWCLAAGAACALHSGARAQETAPAISTATGTAAVSAAAVLDRTLAVSLEHVPLGEALRIVAAQAGIRLSYSAAELPAHKRVSLAADRITVRYALGVLLQDTGLRFSVTPFGRVLIEPAAEDGTIAHLAARQAVGTIAGRVTDARTRAPLPRASVRVEGVANGAMSATDGRYIITNVPIGQYRVTARLLGYAPASQGVAVTANGPATADFALAASAAVLDEVVTTVTGDEKRYTVGNLIETMHADSVVRVAPVTTLSDVINARVPGVQVFNVGGVTGASPSINIRGQNSLILSNQPLLVVDGARVENSAATSVYGNPAGNATNSITPLGVFGEFFGGRLNDLNPEEIQSIEIVKGPSAATLYGTDAANGVIVVTTKRGTAGAPRWDLSIEEGALTLNADRFQAGWHAWGHTTDGSNTPDQCMLLLKAAGGCVIDSVTHFSPLQNPATTPIATGNRQRYAAQVSGGASQTRYFVSGAYESEIAPLEIPARDRAVLQQQRGAVGLEPDNIHPNAVSKASTRLNLSTALGSTADVTVASGLLSQETRLPNSLIWYVGQGSPGYRTPSGGWLSDIGPAVLFAERNREDVTHVTGSANATWHPLAWLAGRATTGLDYSSDYLDQLIPRGNLLSPSGARLNGRVNAALYSVDLGLTASTSLLDVISSKTSIGAQYNHRSELDNAANATNLAPGTVSVAGGAVQTAKEANLETIVTGGYAEQTFGLADRFFLTGGLRADGGSAFGAAFKTQLYPKMSASWLLSGEPWLPTVPGVSSLRLRAAYGSSGVQPGPTDALTQISLAPSTTPAGTSTGGIISTLGDSHLQPEKQTEFEGGVDLEALDRRVEIGATYYNKKSAGALVNLPIHTQLGIPTGTQEINIGSVRNRGVEISANVEIIRAQLVEWSVGVNGSNNQNRLLRLAPGVDATNFGSNQVGYPLFAQFGVPFSYKDVNGDGIIEPNEVTVGPAPVYLGPTYPTSQLTAQTTVGVWRNTIEMHVQVDSRSGVALQDVRALQNFFADARAENDPRSSLAEQAASVAFLTQGTNVGYIENGSFTRLREVSITYTVPPTLTRALHARNASVTLAGRNLALWTRYHGADPEVSSAPSPFTGAAYYDNGAAPVSRYWIARVRVGL